MLYVILAGIGGFIGSSLRYLMGTFISGYAPAQFPYGTLIVNLIGCFLIGLLSGLAERQALFDPARRALVFTGMLGGFTTFATFGNETFDFARTGNNLGAFANIGLHVILGLAAIWLGRSVAALVWR